MTIKIKICCISSVHEANLAIDAGAHALGLVAQMPSGPGVLGDKHIKSIVEHIPESIDTFLLTSRTDADGIASHVQYCNTSTVQIVNHIDPIEYLRLNQLLSAKVKKVQVIHVENQDALKLIDTYSDHVDAFLLDSGKPSAGIPELGGTGRVHDWSISAAFVQRSPVPVYLAGGLNPDNVASAIDHVQPYGLDLCSGVRINGRLDEKKLHRYMNKVVASQTNNVSPANC